MQQGRMSAEKEIDREGVNLRKSVGGTIMH